MEEFGSVCTIIGIIAFVVSAVGYVSNEIKGQVSLFLLILSILSFMFGFNILEKHKNNTSNMRINEILPLIKDEPQLQQVFDLFMKDEYLTNEEFVIIKELYIKYKQKVN